MDAGYQFSPASCSSPFLNSSLEPEPLQLILGCINPKNKDISHTASASDKHFPSLLTRKCEQLQKSDIGINLMHHNICKPLKQVDLLLQGIINAWREVLIWQNLFILLRQ